MIGATQQDRDYAADDRDRWWGAWPRACGEVSMPMSKERELCQLCNHATGRCGEDSIHVEASDGIRIGPLCEECVNGIVHWVANDCCVSAGAAACAEKGGEVRMQTMYVYKVEREKLFTDEGQRLFLKIRDRVNSLVRASGAVRMQEVIAGDSGDTLCIACVDRMVELGELVEITGPGTAGQYRIFTEPI